MSVIEPKQLRPDIIDRIQTLDDESLQLVHHILLMIEKERLWHELSLEMENDRQAGKFERLSEIIHDARAELRKG
jgi:hypothetical protein